MTNIHALTGIQIYDLSTQAIKAYASDCTATGTGKILVEKPKAMRLQ
jgi:hypothetical protein